jgi:hypothetical protein
MKLLMQRFVLAFKKITSSSCPSLSSIFINYSRRMLLVVLQSMKSKAATLRLLL